MDQARRSIEQHAEAINDRDLDVYRTTMNFPFTYQNYNGVALTINERTECSVSEVTPWDNILRTDPDWDRTEFDLVEEVARSVSSVVYKVAFRRIDKSGVASASYQAIWIATCKDGHWGVQFRHNLGL
jgi:hypothetical protein